MIEVIVRDENQIDAAQFFSRPSRRPRPRIGEVTVETEVRVGEDALSAASINTVLWPIIVICKDEYSGAVAR